MKTVKMTVEVAADVVRVISERARRQGRPFDLVVGDLLVAGLEAERLGGAARAKDGSRRSR